MSSEEEMGAIKKLTQAQKNYLIKRIDGLVSQKKQKILNTGAPYSNGCHANTFGDNSVDTEVFKAIVEGKVRLNSGNVICNIIKKKLNEPNNHVYMQNEHYIDPKSLKKFNRTRNKTNKKNADECKKRIDSVDKEASMLKDKVMLEGSLATELLEKFENKEF